MKSKVNFFLLFVITLGAAKLFFMEKPNTFESVTVLALLLLISLTVERQGGE